MGIHTCPKNTECVNTLGDYKCVCKDGFKKKEISNNPETDKFDCVGKHKNLWFSVNVKLFFNLSLKLSDTYSFSLLLNTRNEETFLSIYKKCVCFVCKVFSPIISYQWMWDGYSHIS